MARSLAIAALASLLLVPLAAAQTVTVASPSAKCGDPVNVNVTISSVTGLQSLEFKVAYDASKLTPVSAEAGSFTSGWTLAPNLTTNPLQFALATGTPKSGSGTVVVLRFEVADNASGSTTLTISNILVGDSGGEHPGTGKNGTVTISCVQPPSAPTLKSPANGATGVSAPVKLQWNAISGADEYKVYFGDGTGSPPLAGSVSATSLDVETATGTTYSWNVKATNEAGTSASSATWTFTTSGPYCATPAAPVLTAPATATSGTSYDVSWATVAYASEYTLEESDEPSFANPSKTTTAATSQSFTKNVQSGKTFYYRVRARNLASGCDVNGPYSGTAALVVAAKPPIPAGSSVLLIVSSTAGQQGSQFRTTLQFHNPWPSTITGRIVFHPIASAGGDNDPSYPFSLAPGATMSILDLITYFGIGMPAGSVDLVPDSGNPLPLFVTRIYNDAGASGTSGMTLEMMGLEDVLFPGDTGVVIAPVDTVRMRMNIGIRTLSDGVTMTAAAKDRNGSVLGSRTLTYPATFLIQDSASNVLGFAVPADASITFTVQTGSALVYAAITDNVTNDPNIQIARPIQ